MKYLIASPTSMGVRIVPVERMQIQSSDLFYIKSTSAETNVLNVASSLGKKTLAITKFVEDSPIAMIIRKELRSRGIDYTDVEVPQGGPWGYRHQFNIADSGFGLRASSVWNDRTGEVGRTLSVDDFNLVKIFEEDGVGILHISGLIAALSEQTGKLCLELCEYAKKNGTKVSFDLNYRASFWEGREEELRSIFTAIADKADILLGNEEDFQLCLGLKGPEAGGKDLSAKIDSFKDMINLASVKFPQVQVFATTLREVCSANMNLWGAIIRMNNEWHIEEPRPIDIMDRIGGGDGFTGGLLYGIGMGYSGDMCLKLGWASGVMACGSLNDYADPISEKQLLDIYNGNARVKR